jgi:CubicO group peptidase (beta-lactamase class C family)
MNGRKSIAILWVLLLSGAVYAQSNDDVLSARVDDAVRAQMQEQNIPGVSLAVMRDGKIIKATGYGLANVKLNVPMAPQMVFHSGSLAKAFTATAVMMLVEEGKIGLDDKISRYLPEAPAAWNAITIRRLLTHTSGLRDFFAEDGDPTYDFHQDITEDELVRKFAAQTMRFPTGDQWRYNNAGYVILGVVIHRVTGQFWFDFVKQRIFDPLGMTSTRLIGTDDIIPNRVSGYSLVKGQLKIEPWVAPSWYATADGSLYTNVFDMAKWDAALYTEKLIKHSTLEQMWTPVKLNDGTTYPYGFAWRISEVNGHRRITHDGVDFTFTNRFARYVNDRLSIIIFMNLGEDDEAAMPTRLTDNVAAIYIPGLGASSIQSAGPPANTSGAVGADPNQDKPKAHVAIPVIAARPEDVSSPEAIVRADYESISGGVGVPRQWARDLTLYDPNARYISVYREPKTGQLTPWTPTQPEYVDEADAHAVRVGFIERELAHKTYRFGNIATVLSSFEGKEQSTGKVLYLYELARGLSANRKLVPSGLREIQSERPQSIRNGVAIVNGRSDGSRTRGLLRDN